MISFLQPLRSFVLMGVISPCMPQHLFLSSGIELFRGRGENDCGRPGFGLTAAAAFGIGGGDAALIGGTSWDSGGPFLSFD